MGAGGGGTPKERFESTVNFNIFYGNGSARRLLPAAEADIRTLYQFRITVFYTYAAAAATGSRARGHTHFALSPPGEWKIFIFFFLLQAMRGSNVHCNKKLAMKSESHPAQQYFSTFLFKKIRVRPSSAIRFELSFRTERALTHPHNMIKIIIHALLKARCVIRVEVGWRVKKRKKVLHMLARGWHNLSARASSRRATAGSYP